MSRNWDPYRSLAMGGNVDSGGKVMNVSAFRILSRVADPFPVVKDGGGGGLASVERSNDVH